MLCLTIDIDWAHDIVIADTMELIESYDAKATWFVTHETPVLSRIRAFGGHELGLHPNFNPLFEGEQGKAREIVDQLMKIVPEAISIRSHSLVHSSRLSSLYYDMGFTHESNLFLPPQVETTPGVWRDFSKLIQVPIRWEDDVRLIDPSVGEPIEHLDRLDLFVVDVHPIHIYLNTRTIDDYEKARDFFQDPAELLERRCPKGSGGSRDRLIELLKAVTARSIGNCRLGQVQVPAKG